MAKRRRKAKARASDEPYPGWVWMLFGLSIGLAVAFAIYINDRNIPQPAATALAAQPAAAQDSVDDNGETAGGSDDAQPEQRFDFYNMLPSFEIVITEEEPDVTRDTAPQAVVEPGEYVLQAGSFSTYGDADRRRAQLALHGIESSIQRVSIEDRTYHRVRIGPTRDLDELNVLRARLREASIDVLRIRLGD